MNGRHQYIYISHQIRSHPRRVLFTSNGIVPEFHTYINIYLYLMCKALTKNRNINTFALCRSIKLKVHFEWLHQRMHVLFVKFIFHI